MRTLSRLARKGLTFGGTGGTFDQGPFWNREPFEFVGSTGWPTSREEIAENFGGYVAGAYKANGIVFTCVMTRVMVLSQVRFLYQQLNEGKLGDLAHGPGLELLERPWRNGTTGELVARMDQDVSLAGNFFATPRGTGPAMRLRRLRPDWVTIVSGIRGETDGDPYSLDAEVLGYLYTPNGVRSGSAKPTLLTPDRVLHFSPVPDPDAQWRGMSWLTPIVREIESDTAATKHKMKFFENGTTTNFVVKYDANLTKDQFDAFVAAYKQQHEGGDNAYKTVHLGGGADVQTVGSSMQQLEFKATQGAGESRIAAASGVGAIVAQFSEGMAGSALNSGNYGAARRRFSDVFIRWWWQNAAAALEQFTSPPAGSRLWYDENGIKFLQEDAKDAAEIRSVEATTITTLIKDGFTAESAAAAVLAGGDWKLLKHSGLVSVQLQRPGEVPALPA